MSTKVHKSSDHKSSDGSIVVQKRGGKVVFK